MLEVKDFDIGDVVKCNHTEQVGTVISIGETELDARVSRYHFMALTFENATIVKKVFEVNKILKEKFDRERVNTEKVSDYKYAVSFGAHPEKFNWDDVIEKLFSEKDIRMEFENLSTEKKIIVLLKVLTKEQSLIPNTYIQILADIMGYEEVMLTENGILWNRKGKTVKDQKEKINFDKQIKGEKVKMMGDYFIFLVNEKQYGITSSIKLNNEQYDKWLKRVRKYYYEVLKRESKKY